MLTACQTQKLSLYSLKKKKTINWFGIFKYLENSCGLLSANKNNACVILIWKRSFVYPLIGCLWFIAWVKHTGKGVSSGLIRLQWRQAAWLIYRPELLHCLAFNETVIAPGQLRDECVPNPGWPCVYVRVCRICNHEYNQFHINWPEADRGKKMKDWRASKLRGKVAIAYNKDTRMRNETTPEKTTTTTIATCLKTEISRALKWCQKKR